MDWLPRVVDIPQRTHGTARHMMIWDARAELTHVPIGLVRAGCIQVHARDNIVRMLDLRTNLFMQRCVHLYIAVLATVYTLSSLVPVAASPDS